MMGAQELLDQIKGELGDAVRDSYIQIIRAGATKAERKYVWVTLDRGKIRDAVMCLNRIQEHVHLSVISGYDDGDAIMLVYHFVVFYESNKNAISVNISVPLPKSDPKIDTIVDLVPGALISELEKIEMLGVDVVGLEEKRHVFLPDDFPKGLYPWRRDETSAEKMLHRPYEVGDSR